MPRAFTSGGVVKAISGSRSGMASMVSVTLLANPVLTFSSLLPSSL